MGKPTAAGPTALAEKRGETTRERERRDRFLRLAPARTEKALKALRRMRHLANRSSYAYTDAEVEKMFDALWTEFQKAKAAFEAPAATDKFAF